jgi:hypothetical protein
MGASKKDGTWSKQETVLPTVAMESVFITAVLDTHEGRSVACVGIPGAFLHANVDEDITMVLKGRLAELMVQIAPNLYRKYITVNKKGTTILYVKMQKALHGLVVRMPDCLDGIEPCECKRKGHRFRRLSF